MTVWTATRRLALAMLWMTLVAGVFLVLDLYT
jgi:hypothetical protein